MYNLYRSRSPYTDLAVSAGATRVPADAPDVSVLPLLAVTRPGEAGSVRPRCSSALAFCRGGVILIQFLYLLNFFPVCFNIHFEGMGNPISADAPFRPLLKSHSGERGISDRCASILIELVQHFLGHFFQQP